jgi:hypothetical protein
LRAEPILNCFSSTSGWMSRSAVVIDWPSLWGRGTLISMQEGR